jgi:hypothetical protein
MADMRRAIAGGSFDEFCDATKTSWQSGEGKGKP